MTARYIKRIFPRFPTLISRSAPLALAFALGMLALNIAYGTGIVPLPAEWSLRGDLR